MPNVIPGNWWCYGVYEKMCIREFLFSSPSFKKLIFGQINYWQKEDFYIKETPHE